MVKKYSKEEIKKIIINEARALGVPVDLALALANQESGFNPHVISNMGAIGVMQLMPSTAKYLGVDPYNAVQNIQGGLRYIKAKLNEFNGDPNLALAAYNAGSGAVRKYGGIPPYKETQNYVKSIRASLPGWQKFVMGLGDTAMNGNPLVSITKGVNFVADRYLDKQDEVSNKKTVKDQQKQSQVQPIQPVTVTDPQTGETVEVQLPTSQGSLLERLQGSVTGGAAGTEGSVNPIDALGWGNLTPKTTYEQAQKDAMNYAKAVRDYASEQTLTPETYQGSLEQKLVEAQYGATPEQLQSAYQLGNKNLQQAYDDVQAQNTLTQQALEERYANMRNLVNSDPRLQNQGYRIDPNEIERNLENDARVNRINFLFGGQPLQKSPTAEEVAQRIYQANIANQYGVPYQEYLQSRLDNIQNLLGVDQIQLQNIIARANQGDVTARQYLQYASQAVKDYQTNVGNIGKYNADLAKQVLANQGNIREKGLQSYGNIMNTAAGAGYGIPVAISSDRSKIITQGMSDETTQRGQNIDALKSEGELGIKQAKLPSEINENEAQAAYNRSGALANLYYSQVTPQMGSEVVYGYNLYPENAKPTSQGGLMNLFGFNR